jgi:hypothetical protein
MRCFMLHEPTTTSSGKAKADQAPGAGPAQAVDRAGEINLTQILGLPGSALLDEYQAAAALHMSVRVLQDWRMQNIGPRYIKLNNKTVRYRLCDVEQYRDAQPAGGEGSGPRKLPGKDKAGHR